MITANLLVNEPRFLFRAKAQSKEGAKEEGNQSLVYAENYCKPNFQPNTFDVDDN